MKWLAKLVYNWRSRKMCGCDSPQYVVKDKILSCGLCERPVMWNREGGFIQGRRKT